MEKPKTRIGQLTNIILELSGRDNTLSFAIRNGLVETPSLSLVYPNLDLDETLAFAASSRKAREHGELDLTSSFYSLFSDFISNGTGFIRSRKGRVAEELKEVHKALNPYNGMHLKERLERISDEDFEKVTKELEEPTFRYVTEGIWYKDNANQADMSRTKLLSLEGGPRIKTYAKSVEMPAIYSGQAARRIRKFSREYKQLVIPQHRIITPKRKKVIDPKQGSFNF